MNDWCRRCSNRHPITPANWTKNWAQGANAPEHAKGKADRDAALQQTPPLPQWP